MNKLQTLILAAGLSGVITGMETELLQNIADYMLAGQLELPSAQWKLRKLAELGKLNQRNIKTIASFRGIAAEMAEITVKNAAASAMAGAETGFKNMVIDGLINNADESSMDKTMGNILKTLQKQAKTDLNLINTTMLKEAESVAKKAVRKAAKLADDQKYIDMLNKAAAKTITGEGSMRAAVSQCLKEMSETGIPAFIDKGGQSWTPEAYVNMCVRATVKNTETEALFGRMEDYGTRIIEVSSHSGARPKCAKDQGKLFSLDNKSGYVTDSSGRKIKYYPFSSSSYGQSDGLFGINCGHSGYPFINGRSTQTYFPYDEEENAEQYRKIQKQRELERRVRASKRECAMLKNGDPEMFKKASVRLKQRSARLKGYCSENDLTYQNERTSVIGYGRSEASKVTAAYKRALDDNETKLRLFDVDKCTESDIIKMKGMLSNAETRRWYLQQNKRIPDLIDKSLSIEEQARQACDLRNKFRTQARDLMANQEERKKLDADEPNKSFDELIEHKMKSKKMTRQEAVRDILKTASKTRKSVNKQFGLE